MIILILIISEYEELKRKKIKTKKRKIKLLEEANFYSEEVRRIVSDILWL